MSWWIAFGPHEPGGYGRTGGGFSSSGFDRSHRLSMPSALREQRVVAAHRVVDQPLVRLEQVGGAPGLVQRELQALLVEASCPGPGRLP